MYIRLTYDFPDGQEVEEYHTAKYGAPGQKRKARAKPTPEQVSRHNSLNRIKAIRRLIRWNFKEDDYWLTVTYKKEERPPDMDTAAHDIKLLLNRLRPYYKKAGVQMKWMVKTEIGSRGGIHHHLLINRIPNLDSILGKKWKKGGIYIRLLYSQGGYQKLAEYIEKREGKEYRFSRSRNLIRKDPKKEIMRRGTFSKAPKAKKGYWIIPDSIVEMINPLGFPSRHYCTQKIEDNRIRGSGRKRE